MKYIGAHVSTTGGVENAPKNAQAIKANCFALFTRNPRAWHSAPLTEQHVEAFKRNVATAEFDLQRILPHDSYLINIGSPKDDVRAKSLAALTDELRRAAELGVIGVNFHPGAHLRLISVDECIACIAGGMNDILEQVAGESVLVIENTAGQGSTIGRSFEEIRQIIDLVNDKARVGVCLDTCHLFAAGYDIRTKNGWGETMDAFSEIVGLEYLRGMHLNDSIGALGSNIDRHQSLGMGEIGWEAFEHILQDSRTDGIPLILETNNPAIWAEEIAHLRSFL